MEQRTYYDAATGQIITSVAGTLSMMDLSAWASYPWIEAYGDAKRQYVENGALVDMPEMPDDLSVFDFTTKQWAAPDPEEMGLHVRMRRDALLSKCDWTQIPNGPLSTEKQAQWSAYRQALRDITEQAGFPFNVVYPQAPQ